MTHCDLDLFLDIYSAIDQHYRKQIRCRSLILLSFFDIFVEKKKKFFNNVICFITYSNFYMITLRMHSSRLISIFRGNKVIAIVNWIFHSPWVLISLIILLQYGLISSRYSSIDSILSLSPFVIFNVITTETITDSYY